MPNITRSRLGSRGDDEPPWEVRAPELPIPDPPCAEDHPPRAHGPSGRNLLPPGEVLDHVRAAREIQARAEVATLQGVLAWALAHPAPEGDGLVPGGPDEADLAGDGAPSVDSFCVAELATALRTTSEGARHAMADALDLAHRLPRLWRETLAGRVAVWRARRVASNTRLLNREAAWELDRRLAAGRFRCLGPVAIDRLVEAIAAELDPDLAEQQRVARSERRRIGIHLQDIDINGLVPISGVMDAADARVLDDALNRVATALGKAGVTSSHDVRRTMALAHLASGALPRFMGSPDAAEPDAAEPDAAEPPLVQRRVTLYVHLNGRDLLPGDDPQTGVGQCEGFGAPVLMQTIKAWCAASSHVSIRPVLDLNDSAESDRYEIPARIAEQVALRDETCVFPYCNRRARACDVDHISPHGTGGATHTDNLAALCRYHHRIKTHHPGWSYARVDESTYVWRTPHGSTLLRSRDGTVIPGGDGWSPGSSDAGSSSARSSSAGNGDVGNSDAATDSAVAGRFLDGSEEVSLASSLDQVRSMPWGPVPPWPLG